MNVREMLEEIPKRYPDIRIQDPKDEISSWKWFRLYFQNGWLISAGYGVGHYCDNHYQDIPDHRLSKTVEIAIFKPNGDWHVTEGMSNIVDITNEDGTVDVSGVLAWQTSDQLFTIIEYVKGM